MRNGVFALESQPKRFEKNRPTHKFRHPHGLKPIPTNLEELISLDGDEVFGFRSDTAEIAVRVNQFRTSIPARET